MNVRIYEPQSKASREQIFTNDFIMKTDSKLLDFFPLVFFHCQGLLAAAHCITDFLIADCIEWSV